MITILAWEVILSPRVGSLAIMRPLLLLCLNALLCAARSDDLTRSDQSEQPRDQDFLDDIERLGGPEIEPFHRPSPAPLKCFQVAQPVLGPSGPVYQDADDHSSDGPGSSCSVVLMRHSFGFSYGKPYVGKTSYVLAIVLCGRKMGTGLTTRLLIRGVSAARLRI